MSMLVFAAYFDFFHASHASRAGTRMLLQSVHQSIIFWKLILFHQSSYTLFNAKMWRCFQ